MSTTARFESAVETFENHTDMSRSEAEVFVLRELAGVTRGDAAAELDKSESTLDTQHQAAKQTFRLPEISQVDRGTHAGDRCVDIWFANGARLRYRADEDRETIIEETFPADDPDSVLERHDLALDPDELHDVALESISMYLRDYRDDLEACRFDWHNVFEAITLYGP